MFSDCLLYAKDDGVIEMLKTYYRILKHDQEGKLIKDTGLLVSHSYVIQFLEIIEGFFSKSSPAVTATDVANAESVIVGPFTTDRYGRVDAAVGNDTYGIVVGTNAGTSAEDNEDYALDTKIATGGGGGQLNYQAVTFVAPRTVGPNIDFDISRAFVNASGGTITVKEIGIIIKNTNDTKYHLLLRDVVTDEPVDAAETLTVVYVLRTTA